jgi:hypothetical protein
MWKAQVREGERERKDMKNLTQRGREREVNENCDADLTLRARSLSLYSSTLFLCVSLSISFYPPLSLVLSETADRDQREESKKKKQVEKDSQRRPLLYILHSHVGGWATWQLRWWPWRLRTLLLYEPVTLVEITLKAYGVESRTAHGHHWHCPCPLQMAAITTR